MVTIYVHVLPVSSVFTVEMQKGAKILSVQSLDGDIPCLWAEADPHASTELRKFYFRVTGHEPKPDNCRYIATVIIKKVIPLAYHLYEDLKTDQNG